MEPLDWQKMGFEPEHRRDKLRAQQAIRAALANSRLPEYPSDGTAREFIKQVEEDRGVMGEGEHREWPLDAGIPTDNQMELPLFSEEQAACAMASILSAPERGVDMVTLPAHYARYVIEPIRFICENKLDFFQGNVVKYIVRHDAKNGIEDIDKVIRYAQMYKRFLMKDPDWWKAGKPEDLGNG